MTKRRVHAQPRQRWTPEDDAAVRALYPDMPAGEIATMLGRPLHCIYSRAQHLHVKKSAAFLASQASGRVLKGDTRGESTRFVKGQPSVTKGTRRPGFHRGRMQETQFKKGQAGWNHYAIGATRFYGGYWWVKVSDERRVVWTKNWRQSHIVAWEAAHGPVPADHRIVFRNRDVHDITLPNLECITLADLAIRNMADYPVALRRINHLRGRLTRAINKRARREK